MSRTGTWSRLALAVVLCLVARGAGAQGMGSEFVTFWRGDLRVFATRPDTLVTIFDLSTGLPLDPATWTGNFTTNPFTLSNIGDSFEGNNAGTTMRVRIKAETAAGPVEGKPVVAWTGWIAATLKHPPAPPVTANSWASYIPDVQTGIGGSVGSELGVDFIGFSTRDVWIFARQTGTPISIRVEDLATNTDSDSDDNLLLDASSPYLIHADADVEIYAYHEFEDDTLRITSNVPASVLAGIVTPGSNDWLVSPPSYAAGDRGRELGTEFYVFDARWLTIMPVEDSTWVTVTDLSDGDDSARAFLSGGDRLSPVYDMYMADNTGETAGQVVVPRFSAPQVRLYRPPGGAIDDDLLKITSDRPVLVQLGPIASNTAEFADVAYSIPTGPTSQLIQCYVQNGGANDLQLFSFSDTNNIRITSLSYTATFGTGYSDFSIPSPTPFEGGNAVTNDWFWSVGSCGGEILRIESDQPVQVMSGDYDGENYGAFIPFVAYRSTSPPRADAGPDIVTCPYKNITLDGSGSVDGDTWPGGRPVFWDWDLDTAVDTSGDAVPDNDRDASGSTVFGSFPPGVHVVKLTYTDDDGETGTDYVTVSAVDTGAPALDCPPVVSGVATDFSGGLATPMASVSDDCDPAPAVSNDRTAGGLDASDTYPCGHTLVTFSAADASGNGTTCRSEVVIAPIGTLTPVGGALRVTKTPAWMPDLDWSLVGAIDPASRSIVMRSLTASSGWGAAPGAEALTSFSWVDDVATESLIFYDVRTVLCDGTRSAD